VPNDGRARHKKNTFLHCLKAKPQVSEIEKW